MVLDDHDGKIEVFGTRTMIDLDLLLELRQNVRENKTIP